MREERKKKEKRKELGKGRGGKKIGEGGSGERRGGKKIKEDKT